jgi:hypothetical protein
MSDSIELKIEVTSEGMDRLLAYRHWIPVLNS